MKKIITYLAALTLLLCCLLPLRSQAATIVDSGTCGANTTWSLDSDGVLTISGSGAMYDYGYIADGDPAPAPWADHRDTITGVVLPVDAGFAAYSGE